ncbi:unnamed protein product [Closterium sp. NIES-64]|nr:unnamed protein product [Closterium sp. NIES-64]
MCINFLPCSEPDVPGIYWRDDDQWRPYDRATSRAILKAASLGLQEVNLGVFTSKVYPNGQSYTLNLQTMEQRNPTADQGRPVLVIPKLSLKNLSDALRTPSVVWSRIIDAFTTEAYVRHVVGQRCSSVVEVRKNPYLTPGSALLTRFLATAQNLPADAALAPGAVAAAPAAAPVAVAAAPVAVAVAAVAVAVAAAAAAAVSVVPPLVMMLPLRLAVHAAVSAGAAPLLPAVAAAAALAHSPLAVQALLLLPPQAAEAFERPVWWLLQQKLSLLTLLLRSLLLQQLKLSLVLLLLFCPCCVPPYPYLLLQFHLLPLPSHLARSLPAVAAVVLTHTLAVEVAPAEAAGGVAASVVAVVVVVAVAAAAVAGWRHGWHSATRSTSTGRIGRNAPVASEGEGQDCRGYLGA